MVLWTNLYVLFSRDYSRGLERRRTTLEALRMGHLFRYVSDEALEGANIRYAGAACHHCERSDVLIYPYYGEIVDCALAANPTLALEEPEVSEVCADCINAGNLKRKGEGQPQLATISAEDRDAVGHLVRQFHRLIDVPTFSQGMDWPICHGDWCEFIGWPASTPAAHRIQSEVQAWGGGPVVPVLGWFLRRERLWKSDFVPEVAGQLEGQPREEWWDDINVFRCHRCRKHFVVSQPT